MSPVSGAIGGPGIGSMPIGAAPFDWEATVISQYANSPRLLGWVGSFAAAMEQQPDMDAFYEMLWNIQTAVGYGLDVWGRIVVVERTLKVASRYLGFEEGNSNSDYDPFNVSPFYPGGGTTTNVRLSDDAFRLLILAKAAANVAFGSIPGINRILQLLFPMRGYSYARDNLDMTMTYVFGFSPSPVELAIIETSNVLPRPTGVLVGFSFP